MAITSKGLQELGFESLEDYVLESDANGVVYIREWKSASPQPTEAEIEVGNDMWKAKAYSRTRSAAYPSIGDQLDMLWHAVDTGDWTAAKVKTTEFYTALKAVKDANPKP